MNNDISKRIKELIDEGNKLLPHGGGDFEDDNNYNYDMESDYLAWRVKSIHALSTLGDSGAKSAKEIEQYRGGICFHKASVRHILAHLIAAQDIVNSGFNESENVEPIENIVNLCQKFHSVATQLKRRYGGRDKYIINDEYDVQDLLHALLKIHFDDIRREEYTPSKAGKSSRMDFLLKKEKIVIEVKMTRSDLTEKKLGEELTLDKDYYQKHQDCETLICFIYDPEPFISNPHGFINDMEKSDDSLTVRVIISTS